MEVFVIVVAVPLLALLVPAAWWGERRRRRLDAVLLSELNLTADCLEYLNLRMAGLPAGSCTDSVQPLDD